MKVETNRIILGDAREALREFPDETFHVCVTSPPYFGLRNYGGVEPTQWANGWTGCLGLEPTPDQYVAHLVEVFREVRRVLRKDATLWLNLGDSYASHYDAKDEACVQRGRRIPRGKGRWGGGCRKVSSLKPKDLIGIPWLVAFALRADGWWLRQNIIWSKKNCLPESVEDRPSTSHEFIFLLSRSKSYYYDAEAIRERYSESYENDPRHETGSTGKNVKEGFSEAKAQNPKRVHRLFDKEIGSGRNARSVWTFAIQPYPGEHYATYPTELPRRPILVGTSEIGCCPKCGAPWKREVEAVDHGFADRSFRSPHRTETEWNTNATGATTLAKVIERKTVGWRPTCECDGRLKTEIEIIDGKKVKRIIFIPDERYQSVDEIEVEPCIVLDPFVGSGTSCLVANNFRRRWVGIDADPNSVKEANKRIAQKAIWEVP